MNYELAKQLKDAGFPQQWEDGKGEIDCPCRNKGKGNIMTQSELDNSCGKDFEVYKPTLDELINECIQYGTEINIVISSSGKASAKQTNRVEHFNGDDIEEAVARLWLELNKK